MERNDHYGWLGHALATWLSARHNSWTVKEGTLDEALGGLLMAKPRANLGNT